MPSWFNKGSADTSLRVMIVEDEAIIALDVTSILEEAGYKVVGQAVSMDEALALAAKTKPQIAIMDVSLGASGSGIEVATALGEVHQIPVLFLTGSDAFRVRAMALDIQPLGYVMKPYLPEDILQALQSVG